MQLDELDVAILGVLLEDARASNREVARRVDSSPTTVGQRLQRMTEVGLVAGASLRLVPEALPGHARLVQGRVAGDGAQGVLDAARRLPGVVEAVVAPEGRFVAVLVVVDLDQEETVHGRLAEAGVVELGVVGARRVSGPPPVHLFEGSTGFKEVCAECGKQEEKMLEERVGGRRVVFCCASCKRLYLQRYRRLARGADEKGA